MDKKIKAITFKHIEIWATTDNAEITESDNYFAIIKQGETMPSHYIGKEYVDKIEYESESPKLLKRPDGSLISEPEEGASIWRLEWNTTDHKIKLFNSGYSRFSYLLFLKKGYVFLEEDKNLADKKRYMLIKQLEIQFEIDRLNAEEEEKAMQKYYFRVSADRETVGVDITHDNALNVLLFSETTYDKIIAKYSQDELKQYLKIIT